MQKQKRALNIPEAKERNPQDSLLIIIFLSQNECTTGSCPPQHLEPCSALYPRSSSLEGHEVAGSFVSA